MMLIGIRIDNVFFVAFWFWPYFFALAIRFWFRCIFLVPTFRMFGALVFITLYNVVLVWERIFFMDEAQLHFRLFRKRSTKLCMLPSYEINLPVERSGVESQTASLTFSNHWISVLHWWLWTALDVPEEHPMNASHEFTITDTSRNENVFRRWTRFGYLF